ncbi:MAG: ATP-grasp domain-containing protein [Chitinophagales bacterium]
MKKILFLGAATFQLPPIQYAKSRGYTVITSDNNPDNPGHQLAERAYNVSTVDKKGILKIAEKEKIDGIMTFASDVSMPAVAYVSEKLKLPGANYETTLRLTNKAQFRQFLQREELQTQFFQSFESGEKETAMAYLRLAKLPVIVKPVDRSGSRGVGIVRTLEEAERRINEAFEVSIKKEIIIEEYIEKQGRQVCGDGYMEMGRLLFVAFGDGHFYQDPRFMAPYAETFPSQHSISLLKKVAESLERILLKAGYYQGAFNLDVLITKEKKIFVNEIGPRCGGNYIPLLIQLTYGVDLVAASVEGCLNARYQLPAPRFFSPEGYYASFMLHSLEAGNLKAVQLDNSLKNKVHAHHSFISKKSKVAPFYQAGAALGNIVFRFDTQKEMHQTMDRINELVKVVVE